MKDRFFADTISKMKGINMEYLTITETFELENGNTRKDLMTIPFRDILSMYLHSNVNSEGGLYDCQLRVFVKNIDNYFTFRNKDIEILSQYVTEWTDWMEAQEEN